MTHTGTFVVEAQDAARAETLAESRLDAAWRDDPQDPTRITDMLEDCHTQEEIEIERITEIPPSPPPRLP